MSRLYCASTAVDKTFLFLQHELAFSKLIALLEE